MHDEWFADEENARKTVGLLEKLIEIPKEKEVRISMSDDYIFYCEHMIVISSQA